jgi:hypothetical protein
MNRFLTFSLAILLLGLSAGCELVASDDEDDGMPAPVIVDFGDPYAVVTQFASDEPPTLPRLQGDSLLVRVQYSGGCREHAFALNHQEFAPMGAELWLEHDDRDDACEALVTDWILRPLPDDLRGTPFLRLLTPDSSYTVRNMGPF